jgi:hypothetical protein
MKRNAELADYASADNPALAAQLRYDGQVIDRVTDSKTGYPRIVRVYTSAPVRLSYVAGQTDAYNTAKRVAALVAAIQRSHVGLIPRYLTFGFPSGDDIRVQVHLVKKAYSKLMKRVRRARERGRKHPLSSVCWWHYRIHIKRVKHGVGWHVHIHALVLTQCGLNRDAVAEAWRRVGGGDNIDISPVDNWDPFEPELMSNDVENIIKYCHRPDPKRSHADHYLIYQQTKGLRLGDQFGRARPFHYFLPKKPVRNQEPVTRMTFNPVWRVYQ